MPSVLNYAEDSFITLTPSGLSHRDRNTQLTISIDRPPIAQCSPFQKNTIKRFLMIIFISLLGVEFGDFEVSTLFGKSWPPVQ